jgi:hypothetical protein
VEPPSAAALLDPTAGVGEELESNPTDATVVLVVVAPWYAVFIAAASVVTFATASSAAFVTAALSVATFSDVALSAEALSAANFTVAASSTAFAAVASSTVLISASFSAATTAVETSLSVWVDPLGAINAATLRSGCGALATLGTYCPDSGAPLIVDPPLQNCLILLYRGTSSSSDDTSISLSTTRGTTLPFSLQE